MPSATQNKLSRFFPVALATLGLVAAAFSLYCQNNLQKQMDETNDVLDRLGTQHAKIKPWAYSYEQMKDAVEQLQVLYPSLMTSATSIAPGQEHTAPAGVGIERRYGEANSQFTLVEFSDTECPYCQQFYPAPKALVDGSRGNISLIFKHVPLHGENSRLAALTAECAADQGGNQSFFRMIGSIFSSTAGNGRGTQKPLSSIAEDLGLDSRKITACVDSGRYDDKIRADLQEAVQAGVKVTPTTLIIHNPTGRKQVLSGAYPPDEIVKAMSALVNGGSAQPGVQQ
ncbi:DsbA family protein (plasmid) [Pseudomonas mandelii]|uniref:DsbA family protein n=1 Tax=Pseudomonas mandelii TaxID=75612 RepID=UPI00398D5474